MFAFMKISPRELTATRMWVIKRRILQYAHSYNQMPYSLSDLLTIEGYDNSIEDGWGRVITSKVSPLGTVTLISLGRDGKVGGSGNNADLVAIFTYRDANNGWNDEFIQWDRDPSRQ
jgi:hypothetical protein